MVALAALAALAVLAASPAPASGAAPGPTAARPNIVLVVLDDADAEIVETLPRLKAFGDAGLRFTAHFANTPLCGPARATILTGEYAHSTRVYYNNGAEGGYTPWLKGDYDRRNLGPRLQSLGYRTGLFGKYLNDFPNGKPETFVPSGWDDFRAVLSDREAHNDRYTLNENGTLKLYEAASGGYQTDVLAARLGSFIAQAESDPRPFFAFLAVSAPHVPPEPAARHRDAFPGSSAPRKRSYDEADLSDKPKALQEQAKPLSAADGRDIDVTYRGMRQSLLAVEEAIEAVRKSLAAARLAERTWIFVTSDNGWHRGEHRIPSEKYTPYEESIRVPLFVQGPGIAASQSVSRLTGLVDLAPTILDLAGAAPGILGAADGRSLVPLLTSRTPDAVPWRSAMLIEHFGGGSPFRVRSYSGIRSAGDLYVEYATGEKEFYDLAADPAQLVNRASELAPSRSARLAALVAALRSCRGSACRAAEEGKAPAAPVPPAKSAR